MDWVSKHLQVIIAIAGAVAWWLTQRKNAQAGGAAEAPPAQEKTFDDPELAERTRRIREEIQRKIEQRAKGYAQEQPRPVAREAAEPPPVIREIYVEPPPAPVLPPVTRRQEAQRNAEILEQQQALMEKLAEARLMKTSAEKRTRFEEATADHAAEARSLSRSTLLDDLREPAALRRAFILREVLGPPVALRN
jgi:hypothetical protein